MREIARVQLFGVLALRQGDQTTTRFRTQQTGALLAYLAYYRRQAHPREVLIDLLWPDVEPNVARSRLSVALSSLRRQIETTDTVSPLFLADHFTVQLNPACVTTDVASFEETLDRAERATTGVTERAMLLTEAVDLYRGSLLPGYYESWIVLEQERLRERFLQAAHRLVLHRLQAGERVLALDVALRAAQEDPLNEQAHSDVLRIYSQGKQPAEARRHFSEMSQRFAEAGSTPGRALWELVREIERGVRAEDDSERTSDAPPSGARQSGVDRVREAAASYASYAPEPLTGAVTILQWEMTTAAVAVASSATREDYRRRLSAEMARFGGQSPPSAVGDSAIIFFADACDALSAAAAALRAFATGETGEIEETPRIRVAIDAGTIRRENGELYGEPLRRVSRLLLATNDGQILATEAVHALLHSRPPEGITLRDLGIFRLRDVPRSEHLFQVCYPGKPARISPAPRAEQGYASTLPPTLTRFFGRETEIAELESLLGDRANRLVTLLGSGGIGKTRLSLEVAARFLAPLHGRVYQTRLVDLKSAHDLVPAIRDAMQIAPAPGVEPLRQVVEALREAPALLVLDNFEYIVEEGADIVLDLIVQCPSVQCLITSRILLNLTPEREFRVETLPLPAGDGPWELLLENPAVRLFCDRARAVRTDFRAGAANVPAIADLCRRLEGLPLAIELAAARASLLTPARMLKRMGDRFGFLKSGKRDIPARHRSLWTAIDTSYQLLAPAHQRLFRILSVFRGGWTMASAHALCEASENALFDDLLFLQQCSLIGSEESIVGMDPEMRFRMLESLREYGQERLDEAGEDADARARHRDVFLAYAEEAEPHLQSAEQKVWLDQLSADHDNLRAALDRFPTEEKSLCIAAAMHRFWMIRGHLAEGMRRLSELLDSQEARSDRIVAKALNGLGVLALSAGRYKEAKSVFERELQLLRKIGTAPELARVLNNIGIISAEDGDMEDSRRFLEESLVYYREASDLLRISIVQSNLGAVYLYLRLSQKAREVLEESLKFQRQHGAPLSVAMILQNLADAANQEGDTVSAARLLLECFDLRQTLEDKAGIAILVFSTALLAGQAGSDEEAVQLLGATATVESVLGTSLSDNSRQQGQETISNIITRKGGEYFDHNLGIGQSMTLQMVNQYMRQTLERLVATANRSKI